MRFGGAENKGWVQLPRSLFTESEYLPTNFDRPFTKFEAKIWLLAHANYTESQVGSVKVKPGQILTSTGSLAKVWQWEPTRVFGFLFCLEKQGWIKRDVADRRYLITVYGTRDGKWNRKRDDEQRFEWEDEILVFVP